MLIPTPYIYLPQNLSIMKLHTSMRISFLLLPNPSPSPPRYLLFQFCPNYTFWESLCLQAHRTQLPSWAIKMRQTGRRKCSSKKGKKKRKRKKCISVGKERRIQKSAGVGVQLGKLLYNLLDAIYIPKFLWLKFRTTNE